MQIFGLLSLLVTIAVAAWWFTTSGLIETPPGITETVQEVALDPVIVAEIEAHTDLVQLTSPKPNESITSPFTITGKARGTWYFEGSFPVILTSWDGLIITEQPAMARGEWMTEEFVPFTLTLSFESPYHTGDPDFMRRGSLILKKDNPSGLSEHDDALEIPIMFTATGEIISAQRGNTSYGEAIESARDAARSLEF